METSKDQILIAGYFGRRNAGDECILQGMLATLRAKCSDASFVVVSADPAQTSRYHHVRSIHWSDIEGLMDEVERSALVIVGGGGLFHDYWGFDETSFLSNRQGGISEFGSPLIWAHLRGIPSMLYCVGVGPLREKTSQNAVRELFSFANEIVVRDEYSKHTLEKIGLDSERVQVAADPAFSAPGISIDEVMPEIRDVPRPLLGVSVRPWPFSGSQERWEFEIAKGLQSYLDSQPGTVLFVPMQDGEMEIENDVLVCERIRDLIGKRERVLPIARSIEPIHRISIFENCDLVLGMRLHSLIGAIRGGVSCVALSYDPKVKALMEDAKLLDNLISLEEIKAPVIYEKLVTAREHEDHMRPRIKQRSIEFAVNISSITERVQFLIEQKQPNRGTRSNLIPILFKDHLAQLDKVLLELADLQNHLQETQSQLEDLKTNHDEQHRLYQSQLVEAEEKRIDLQDSLNQVKYDLQRSENACTELSDRLQKTLTQLKEFEEGQETVRAELSRVKKELQEANMHVKELQGRIHTLEKEKADVAANERHTWELYSLEQRELEEVKASKGWIILNAIWRIVWRLRACFWRFFNVPQKCLRYLTTLAKELSTRARRLLPIWLRGHLLSIDLHRYEFIDNSKVVLYTDYEGLFPGYQPRASLTHGTFRQVDFSLIVTVVNEVETIESWMKALEMQSRAPNEVVIVDGGSIDGTAELLKRCAEVSPLDIRIYIEEGINIAQGRNIAIERASYDIIVVSDFGSDLSEDYLANIIRPFEKQPEMQVVAGWFDPLTKTQFGKWAKYELVPRLCNIDPQNFLPSARSMAFHRGAWCEVGGYPEWLTLTGDDTYIALELKRYCRYWAFVPEAVVLWHAPGTLRSFWRKLISWSQGDGESGVYGKRYFRFALFSVLLMLVALLVCGMLFAILSYATPLAAGITSVVLLVSWYVFLVSLSPRFGNKTPSILSFLGQLARSIGFIQGVKRRPQATKKRYAEVEGVVFIFSGIPIDDTGGGSRGAQITREFLARNYLAIYLYKFPKAEHKDLRLSIWHPRLLHGAVANMDWKAFTWQYRDLLDHKQILTLVEFPLKDFLPYIESIKECGGKVIYDLIDDWKSSLGGTWYSEVVEKRIYHQADLLIATAQELVRDLRMRSKREVHLLPNAVNPDLFNRRKKYERPQDLPRVDLQIIYIGALWGEWFDWQLMDRMAERFPHAAITVIGDYDGRRKIHSDNVHFLGLKGQDELPSYLAYSDIAVIPWENTPLTQATSPLKVYEYLAMGLPVIAPNIATLTNMPYVFRVSTREEFLDAIQDVSTIEIDLDEIDRFILQNSWSTRVKWLIEHAR